MNEKAIDMNALPALTSVDDSCSLLASGPSAGRVSMAKLREAVMGGISIDAVMSNVFIMYNTSDTGYPRMSRPSAWPSLQRSGQVATGVVIVEGGKVLVVAPTEADTAGLLWSSAAVSGGATTTADRVTAMSDWNGKANTASIISKSSPGAITDTTAYAPGFCYGYSRLNANGAGLSAGKWWLPSLGEIMMIDANLHKVNYCLSLIDGADLIRTTLYYTSTEGSAANAWVYNFGLGDVGSGGRYKYSFKGGVRPVSAFIQ